MGNPRHIAENFKVGALLSLVGGYLDTYTYICRDGVFANAQTGNIVLMGLRLTDGEFAGAVHYLIPILSFVIGVIAVEMIKSKFNDDPRVHWHQLTLTVEMVILAAVAFIPASRNDLANVLVSLTCAMQVEGFRRLNGNAYATTMCTGNLRSGSESLFAYFKTKDVSQKKKAIEYYSIILIFIIGAAIGAVVTRQLGRKAVLVCLAGQFAALMILKAYEDTNEVPDEE
ncbi:YoaK family protein [uncultured Ruminococcus sp.]|uniref:YoaK family protein n=1 Tax=uncultured Ruminococcus sp. TaxID=165186 RepID=UPI0025DC9455|nr:YoaK family protein [uncultured Ruminococcus sp.]